MKNMIKKAYSTPELTVVHFASEQGFALSLQLRPIEIEIAGGNPYINNYDVVNNVDGSYATPSSPGEPSQNFWNF